IQPRPIQPELDIWLTCQQDASFATCGELGYKVLTNLNYKKRDDLARKSVLYHEASQQAHGRHGHFTLMAHTFVGTDDTHVWSLAGTALMRYLETRVDMDAKTMEDLEVTPEDRAFLARRGTEQFLGETSLIGTEATCTERAADFHRLGVDEIACLIDFGVPFDEVMASLERIVKLRATLQA
ncbi:MAG TPA: LLM class flavin-dependent oxidoreductase, partial [Kofleriaceae bacterium]